MECNQHGCDMANNLGNSLAPGLRTPPINNTQPETSSKASFFPEKHRVKSNSILCFASYDSKAIEGSLPLSTHF